MRDTDLEKREDLPAIAQTHKSHPITVETRTEETGIHLSWKKDGHHDYEIVGYRRVEGFSARDDSNEDDGTLILQSSEQEGQMVDQALQPETPYYYVFQLRIDNESYHAGAGRIYSFFVPSAPYRYCYAGVLRFAIKTPPDDLDERLRFGKRNVEIHETVLSAEQLKTKIKHFQQEPYNRETALAREQEKIEFDKDKELLELRIRFEKFHEAKELERELEKRTSDLKDKGLLSEEEYEERIQTIRDRVRLIGTDV